jgi:hypothetical protein
MTDKHDRSKPHRAELPLPASASEHFPTFNKSTVQDPSDLFVSVKTTTAIPVRHPAVRDALIQSSLGPRVRSITYVAAAVIEEVDLGAIVVKRDDGRFLLDVVKARRIGNLEDEGLALIALAELGPKLWTTAPAYSAGDGVWTIDLWPAQGLPERRHQGIARARDSRILGCVYRQARLFARLARLASPEAREATFRDSDDFARSCCTPRQCRSVADFLAPAQQSNPWNAPTSRLDCDAVSVGAEGIEASFKQSDDLRPACSGRENAAVESLQSLGANPWDSLRANPWAPWVRIRGVLGTNPWNAILGLNSSILGTPLRIGGRPTNPWQTNPWTKKFFRNGKLSFLDPKEEKQILRQTKM